MPSVSEMVEHSRVFLVDILPKAAVSVSWTLNQAEKAFQWARYCEEMHDSLVESGHLQELDEALAKAGETTGKYVMFRRTILMKAPLLLLEEFLRNPDITEDTMFCVMKAMSNVFPPIKFQELCLSAAKRKALHQNAVALIHLVGDSDAILLVKAMILKEDLMQDLSPGVLEAKLEPLLKSVQMIELLLTVLSLASESETLPEVKLSQLIIRVMEMLANNWLDQAKESCHSRTISGLLAVPVALSRKLCEMSPNFFQSWLKILALLASHLTPIYYEKDHVWSWPENDETSNRFRGLWFSFDQLFRHMQSLWSPPASSPLNEDHVTSEARQFLERQKQLPGLVSIWMEVEQRLSINASN